MELNLTRKQANVLEALGTREYSYLLFGGGVGSGKSVLMSYICILNAVTQPRTRYGVFRKNLTTLKRTTLQTFMNSAEAFNLTYEFNRADMVWTLSNGSQIYFIELDHTKDPDFNKIKSLELTAAFIDEANELVEKAFSTLITRVGRNNKNGEHFFIFMTCNPDQGWIKEKFYDKWALNELKKPFFYEQALPVDNPFLPQSYIDSLENLPEAEYLRYVKGNWDYTEDDYQLISYQIIKNNLVSELVPLSGEKRLGVDVARSGADSSVITQIDEKQVLDIQSWKGNDINWSSLHTKNYIDTHQIKHQNVHVDTIGLGAGVADNLRAWGYDVNDFNSAGSASTTRDDQFAFGNIRAEAYWELRQHFIDGKMLHKYNEVLQRQLLSIRYEIRGKNIFIEDKEKIKKRLGESPDLADSLAMAVYNSQSIAIEAF